MSYKFKKSRVEDKFANAKVLAEIQDLKMSLRTKNGDKLVINGATLKVREGEILGILGESGSGKTIITTTWTGLNTSIQKIEEGKVILNNQDVTNWDSEKWEESRLRGRFVSQVFQNPLSSLNPYRKISSQIIESIQLNSDVKLSKKEAWEKAIDFLEMVKISDPLEVMDSYPHQLSGGMNQRIVIISILASNPKLIIFDEPTTALDPAVQAEIIEIIRDINKKTKTSIVFITHDIALLASLADTMIVMYAGRIVEQGTTKEIIEYPLHPYTWGLLMSIPGDKKDKLFSIPGLVPSDISKIEGDAFANRNNGYSLKIDFHIKPPKVKASNTHFVWSWLYDQQAPKFSPPKFIKDKWDLWK